MKDIRELRSGTAQQGYGPPSLPVGTEVSAKYRGAFCEATVKSVVRVVKCKVLMKDCQSCVFVTDEEIKGTLKLGSVVEVKHPDTGQPVEGTINKLVDQSTYTVVFDDGDERTLRRTQLCLKGDKHFIESETLDNLPLSHPEHFGTPVLQSKKSRRRNGEDSDDGEDEEDDEEDSEVESPRRATYRGRHQELVGKLMLVDMPHRKGSVVPALVVLPDANTNLSEVKGRDQILLRSFKDSKFFIVHRKDLKEFTRPVAIKNEDKTLRTAFERALLYFDTKELPVGWNKSEMLGSDVEDDEEDNDEDEYASEDEPFEEKDRFVAQLYKFMDDRGTPINKGPSIGNKDLNLYKLFKIVQHLGGYNKVTKEMKWPVVYSKMGLPSLHLNPAHQIKTAYKKYLDAYETFYRKLGSTMGTLSRPGRARQNSGRSILNFRAREKSPRSPQTPQKYKDETSDSPKSKTIAALAEKVEYPLESSVEEADVTSRRIPKRDSRTPAVKEEVKDKKEEVIVKPKKEEGSASKSRRDDMKTEDLTLASKGKKNEPQKKDEDPIVKKEERKSVRKAKVEEDVKEVEKEDKKTVRLVQREKEEDREETVQDEPMALSESPKKRVTRRKLLTSEIPKDLAIKQEEEGKESKKRIAPIKDQKPVEKKEKEIPKTLERRDSRVLEKKDVEKKEAEKKEGPTKAIEKKETVAEKKVKPIEEKKKKEKKPKEDGDAELEESTSKKDTDVEKTCVKIDFPIGSKLRVKYGKGKNQKIYIAKVVDHGKDGVHKTYRVHYAGWNIRYDEWIRPDRVVSVLDRPDPTKVAKVAPTTPKPVPSPLPKKLATPTRTPGKLQDTFRTPKLVSTKTRATRSSSTENLTDSAIKRIGVRKRITRRGSAVTDSGGSKSPESQVSSDAEENTESYEDDESAKDDKEEEEDDDDYTLEEYDDSKRLAEAPADNESEIKTEELVDEVIAKDICDSELSTDQEKELMDSEKKFWSDTDRPEQLMEIESNSSPCDDSLSEMKEKIERALIEKQENVVSGVKIVKSSVTVTEVHEALEEIVSAVELEVFDSKDVKDIGHEPFNESQPHTSTDIEEESILTKFISEAPQEISINTDSETLIDSSSEIKKESEIESDLSEAKDTDTINLPDQSIPLLKREVSLQIDEQREEQSSSKAVRGKKKDVSSNASKEVAKKSIRTLDMSGTNMASSAQEIPLLEHMEPTQEVNTDSGFQQKEPSPYDFEEEAEPSWTPEITKKWEPTSTPALMPYTSNRPHKQESSGTVVDEEKERKKVKKKVKKKPICPEFVDDAKTEDITQETAEQLPSSKLANTLTSSEDAQTSDGDIAVEKPGLRKKGRKKKDNGAGTLLKQDSSDIYEGVVASKVDTAAQALNEGDSDVDTPPVKRRRVKRVSESDNKDGFRASKSMRKGSSKNTTKQEAVSDTKSKSETCVSPERKEEEKGIASSSVTQTVDEPVSNDRGRDNSFCESQGFEPQPELHEESGAYDNTPPTTPEHIEGGEYAQKQERETVPDTQCHPAASSPDLPPTIFSDSSKVVCSSSSVTSCLTLSGSSTNTASASHSKSLSESPSDNDVISTASTDNLDCVPTNPQSEGSEGTDQEAQDSLSTSSGPSKKRRQQMEAASSSALPSQPKKKKRVHGTRSRTARKSPKYIPNSDSQGSASNTPNHCSPESPPAKFVDLPKSPRPSKYNFNADLGEYLEGEARCNFLIAKMKEIKAIYMNLKAEVATIDRRRKKAKRKEKDVAQVSAEKDSSA